MKSTRHALSPIALSVAIGLAFAGQSAFAVSPLDSVGNAIGNVVSGAKAKAGAALSTIEQAGSRRSENTAGAVTGDPSDGNPSGVNDTANAASPDRLVQSTTTPAATVAQDPSDGNPGSVNDAASHESPTRMDRNSTTPAKPAAIASPAAADKPATVATIPSNAARASALEVSDDGYKAMRMIRRARLAIFNGDTAVAKESVASASDSLAAVARAAPTVQSTRLFGSDGKIVGEEQSRIAADAIPIDGQVVWSDDYVDTPVRRAHVTKANEQLAKGHAKAAAEELKLAEVDTSFVWTLMPIASTRAQIDQAGKLMADGKYFEASVALKAAEDGLSTDTFVYVDAPATMQGHKSVKAPAKKAS